jgi:uncharacterized protein (TIGR00255 family)
MTGYGRADVAGTRAALSVEARSLNHRYLDLTIRLPRPLTAFESDVRRLLREEIQRGRIEISVSLRRVESAGGAVQVNYALAQAYLEKLRELARACQLEETLSLPLLLECPGVMSIDESDPITSEEGWSLLKPALVESVKALVAQREAEGNALAHELGRLLDSLEGLLSTITDRAQSGARERQERLHERIKKLLGELSVDEGRLATEVALIADRSDVTEELTRLQVHLGQFRDSLRSTGPMGRTLDFLIQEMNREVNTIGSKVDDLLVTQTVIASKGLLEKLREQVQNLE